MEQLKCLEEEPVERRKVEEEGKDMEEGEEEGRPPTTCRCRFGSSSRCTNKPASPQPARQGRCSCAPVSSSSRKQVVNPISK